MASDGKVEYRKRNEIAGGEPLGYIGIGNMESERARLNSEKVSRKKLVFAGSIALLLVWAVFTIITLPWHWYDDGPVRADSVWLGQDIIAPFKMTSSDDTIVATGRKYVENNNDKVFVVSSAASANSYAKLAALDQIFSSVVGLPDTAELMRSVRVKTNIGLRPNTCSILLGETSRSLVLNTVRKMVGEISAYGMMIDVDLLRAAHQAGRDRLENESNDLISTMTVDGILGFPSETYGFMANIWLRKNVPAPELFDACADLGRQVLMPNVQFSARRTELRKAELIRALDSSYPIPAGTRIVKRGDLVTPKQEALARVIISNRMSNVFSKSLGNAGMVALALAFCFIFIRLASLRWLVFSWRNVLLLATPVLVAVLTPDLIIRMGFPRDAGEVYCLPAGMIGMVFGVLFQGRLGIMMMLFNCLIYGIVRNLDFAFLPSALAGNMCALMMLRDVSERKQLMYAGLGVSGVNLVICLLSSWIDGNLLPPPAETSMAAANGLFCYAMTMGLLPLIEMIFRVATPWLLWEITSLDHPLLREMESKIPGSYQHVLDVAKLSESAAEAVGADRLLVRAGAYFHDVGKIVRPKYFTENQVTPEEREAHKPLPPGISATIVKQHVFDGMRLGKEYRLPEEVVDFIPQHHGTSLITFFYYKALQQSGENDRVSEPEYRYPGPRPQTLETAIVMLADSIEAASTAKFRKAERIHEHDLTKLVDDIIKGKTEDHQLDACPINSEQLAQIRTAFTRSLQARFHGRVEYPNLVKDTAAKDISSKLG